MCLVAVLMAETVGMGETWCLSAIPVVATLVRCAGASTSELGGEKVAKGPIGMGLGGRSF